MITQDPSLRRPEPGASSNGGQIRGGSQISRQATMPKKVMRHQSFPETSTSTQDSTPPRGKTLKQRPPHRSSKSDPPRTTDNVSLSRHGTLLTADATPSRAAAELKSILGDHNGRLKPNAALLRVDSGSVAFDHHVTLEQAKSHARVEVDILPQSNVYVQGGHLRGHVVITARPATNKEPPIFFVGGKIRVIGFESLGDKSRSIFYQCSAMMSSIIPELAAIYAPGRDEEGLPQVKEGNYRFPFSLYLSPAAQNGQARGCLRNVPGISLNYIAMASIKIKDGLGRQSIAHFYRSIEVWPRLDPVAILSPTPRPLQLTAQLHRLHWISGQSCRIRVIVENNSNKTLKDIIISLHQTTKIYSHSIPGGTETVLNSRQSIVSSKQIAESILEVGQPKEKGHASAKGWWLGVGPGQKSESEHSILIPLDTLTLPRGQLFEVSHQVHVELRGPHVAEGTQVVLPIRIVGFLSVDQFTSESLTHHLQHPLSLCSSREAGCTTNTSVCYLGQLSAPLQLKYSDDRKEGRQAEEGSNETLAILESPSKRLPYDPSKFTFRTTREVLERGNISFTSNTNGFVQQDAETATTNVARAGFLDQHRVSDECTETVCASEVEHLDNIPDPDPVTSVLESLMEEITAVPSDPCNSEMRTTIPQKLHSSRHSQFATRVQEKSRLATAAYLNRTSVSDSGSKNPRGPLTGRLSHSHQYRGHPPNLSENQGLLIHSEQPGMLVESESNISLDVTPTGLNSPPSGTTLEPQQNSASRLMLGVSQNSYEHLPHVQSEARIEGKKAVKSSVQSLAHTGVTPTTPHVSATFVGSASVKNKIRRLEQVKAAAPV